MPWPLCAVIILLENILDNPHETQANEDAALLGDFVQNLTKSSQENQYDLKSLLRGCQAMERIARDAITAASQRETYIPSQKVQVSDPLNINLYIS